jgi:hypothetical protein
MPPTTFTGDELDIVRHLMPAHEVHQSGSAAWVGQEYGVLAHEGYGVVGPDSMAEGAAMTEETAR